MVTSTLTEKFNEYATKLETLKNARNADIEAKVNAYRQSLMAEDCAEINALQKAIDALRQVIEYESASEPVEAVQHVVHETEGARAGLNQNPFVVRR